VGDSVGAERTLAVLVRLAPNDPAIAVQNAIVRYSIGDIAGSIAEVQRALALDSQNATALRLQRILFAE
jgi:hypothetical protein